MPRVDRRQSHASLIPIIMGSSRDLNSERVPSPESAAHSGTHRRRPDAPRCRKIAISPSGQCTAGRGVENRLQFTHIRVASDANCNIRPTSASRPSPSQSRPSQRSEPPSPSPHHTRYPWRERGTRPALPCHCQPGVCISLSPGHPGAVMSTARCRPPSRAKQAIKKVEANKKT